MPTPLRSCSIVSFRRNTNRLSVFADEYEIMYQSAVAARNPIDRPAWNFKSFSVLSLSVLHLK